MRWNEEKINELVTLYKSGLPLSAIGEKYGITRQRIHQILKKADGKSQVADERKFQRQKRLIKARILEKDLLTEFYVTEGLSIKELQKRFNLGYKLIRKSLVYYRIPIRRGNLLPKSVLTRDLLTKLYLDQNLTAGEIAARLGYQVITIKTRLSKLGIKKRTH